MGRKYLIHSNEYFYFVTFTVVNWIDVFTTDAHRQIFVDSVKYCQQNKGLLVGAWCIMPNHIHLILSVRAGHNLSDCIRDLKSYTSRSIRKHMESREKESSYKHMLSKFYWTGKNNVRNKDFQLWQQHNHPIELCDNNRIETRLEYIHENPVKAGWVDNPSDWVYSSARDYDGRKGLIDIYYLD